MKKDQEPKTFVSDFLDEALSPKLFQRKSFWHRFLESLIENHSYTSMVKYQVSSPRSMRWLAICRDVLINLMIDTMFYKVFYPDAGQCQMLQTESQCLTQPSTMQSGTTLCLWDPKATQQCSLNPPPSGITFFILTSLMMLIVQIPISVFMDIFMGPASQKPNLKQIGWTTDYWFGGRFLSTTDQASTLNMAMGAGKSSASESDLEKMGHLAYEDQKSVEEEAAYILAAANEYFGDIETPWTDVRDSEHHTRAIAKALKCHVGGGFQPLSLFDRIFYRDGRHRLEVRIKRAREKSLIIKRTLNSFAINGDKKYCDHLLVQYFIHENLR